MYVVLCVLPHIKQHTFLGQRMSEEKKLPVRRQRQAKAKHPQMIKHSNEITTASYSLSVAAKRILQMCFAQIVEKEKTTRNEDVLAECTITIADYIAEFKVKSKTSASRDVSRAVMELVKSNLTIRDKNQPRHLWEIYPWFHRVSADETKEHNGVYRLTVNALIVPFVAGVDKEFTYYMLSDCQPLKSFNQIRLYMLLCQYRSSGLWVISASDFVDDEYFQFSSTLTSNRAAMKREFINPSIDKINRHTPLWVAFTDDNGRFMFNILDGEGAKKAKSRAKLKALTPPKAEEAEEDAA